MQAPVIYIASSFKNLYAVQLLAAELQNAGCVVLDWTEKATPPSGLSPSERRVWMDTDHGGSVFSFCETACRNADLVIYLGASGQDAGVEVGIARGAGVPVLGIRGPLESPGLMLHGAVMRWVEQITDIRPLIQKLVETSTGSATHLSHEAIISLLKG